MPTNSRLYIAPFIGGMNTELPQTEDAVNYTLDELNCTILPEKVRGRRYGFNIERDGRWISPTDGITESYSGFFWKNVANTSFDMIVYQTGKHLHFFDASQKPYSQYKISQVIDLSPYITDINAFYQYPVRFSTGSGMLIVVSKYLEPLKISYDFDESEFNIEVIDIRIRDFEGIDDGLDVDELPSELSKEHHYNLLNQGWSESDITQFHTDNNNYPANNLQWFIGKDSSGEFNTETLLRHYFGNTPAPKGHYILNYFKQDRSLVSGIFAESSRKATYNFQRTWVSSRKLEGVMITSFSLVVPESSGTVSHLSLNFTKLLRKSAKKSSDEMWSGDVDVYLYGHRSASDTKTLVHHESYVVYGSPDVHTISLEENTNKYDSYTVEVYFSDGNGTADYPQPLGVTCTVTLAMKEDGSVFPYDIGLGRVTDTAYMSGKYFYLVGNTVLFSQTLTETLMNCGKCYQDADPTSEDISDILPTDGGVVKFQTMGDGLALKTFNRGVIVFGRDTVYGLISPVESKFTATEYDILELSKAGLIGQNSVVSVDTSVYYWSPLGIFQIGVNNNTGTTLVSQSVSSDTIQTYYNNLPVYSKENCRGAFDYVNNRIYWFYPTNSENLNKLDGCLVYDLSNSAFYPFKIAETGGSIVSVFETLNSNMIEPTMYVRAGGSRVVAGGVPVIAAEEETTKYNRWTAIQHCIIDDEGKMSFGDFNSREFYDWDNQQYDSYLLSRPIVAEDTYWNKQVPILQTLFKRTEEYEMNEKTSNVITGVYNFNGTYTEGLNRQNYVLKDINTVYPSKPITLSFKLNGVFSISVGTPADTLHDAVVSLWRVYRDDNGVLRQVLQNKQVRQDISTGDTLTFICNDTNYGDTFEISVFAPKDSNERIRSISFTTTVTYDTISPIIKDKNYVAASGAYIRMRWGWSLNDKSNRWDLIQNAYRPQKDFMNDEFVESRLHIKGRGKAFQLEIRNDSNKDFRLSGMNMIVRRAQ